MTTGPGEPPDGTTIPPERVPVDDLDDPRIAPFRALKANNLTRGSGLFVVEGEKLFDRLRASRYPLVSALVTGRLEARIAPRMPPGTTLYVVPDGLIDRLVGFKFHLGVLACGRRVDGPGLAELVGEGRGPAALAVCPTLNNPENLGAIIRIGDVFGLEAVLVGPRCPDPLSRRVLRVSMGSSLRLPVIVSDRLADEVGRLGPDWGFELLASVVDRDAEPLDTVRAPSRYALFLGNEPDGLGDEWVGRCGRRITIPMRPGADSLNVAVAAGIMVHHFQRGAPPSIRRLD